MRYGSGLAACVAVGFAALTACSGTEPIAPSGDAGPALDSSASPDAGDVSLEEAKQTLQSLSPETLPLPPSDATNKYADNPAAAAFGQRLFFDTRFSGPLLDGDNDGSPSTLGKKGEAGRVACAGCHQGDADFSDTRTLGKQISLASGWNLRKSPSLLDVGHAKLLMWDGRRDAHYNQVFGPFESPLEMNSSRLFVAQQIFANHRAEYEALFGPLPPMSDTTRFPHLTSQTTGCIPATPAPKNPCDGKAHGIPGDGAEYDSMSTADKDAVTRVVVNLGKSIGAFERKLSCGTSRFDAWMRGKEAFAPNEELGARLFVGRGKCITCHSGPYFSDQRFHNVGLLPETVAVVFRDVGDRGAATGLALAKVDPLSSTGAYSDGNDGRLAADASDGTLEGAFRTPTLRCAERRPSYMHTGQMRSLLEVIQFFNRGGDKGGYPGVREISPLGLTPAEEEALAAFVRTLTGPGAANELRGAPIP